ncbi:Aft2/Aft1 [Kluyveromyces lactis]|nr:Aft2/Aft1 [Kluyveromyces lactis]
MKHELQTPIEGVDPLDPLHNPDLWQPSPSFDNMMASPKTSPIGSVLSHTPAAHHVGSNLSSSNNSEVSYNNALSENAIEALRRQQDQNKLIHLDPIPDFKDKSEVKPWLQKIFYPQGIEIVIERSDSMKIVFKCKAVKKNRNTSSISGCGHSHGVGSDSCNTNGKNNTKGNGSNDNKGRKKGIGKGFAEYDGLETETENGNNSNSTVGGGNASNDTDKKKRAIGPYNSCPFRVRATFSLKRKKWNIVVVNNVHTHPLKFNPDSEDYKKFKNALKESGDLETVKKFDELEYRTRFNLPIDLSPIPCDCGLTQEIQSFNIVLPTTNIIVPGSRNTSMDANTVTKPKKTGKKAVKSKTTKQLRRKSTKKKLQQDIESNSANTSRTATPLSTVQNSLNLHFDSQSNVSVAPSVTSNLNSNLALTPQENIYSTDFLPNTASSQQMDSPNFSNFNSNYFNVQNEIDFTEFFSKPLPHFKNSRHDVVTGQGMIPLTFSQKHQTSSQSAQHTPHQNINSNLMYHNAGSTSSTHSSPNMSIMTSVKTPITTTTPSTNSHNMTAISSVPLYSSNLAKEPIQDFIDMNQIFGTSNNNNDHSNANTSSVNTNNNHLHQQHNTSHANAMITSHSLNFQHSNLSPVNQNISAVCEINNFDVCANDAQCGGPLVGTAGTAVTAGAAGAAGTAADIHGLNIDRSNMEIANGISQSNDATGYMDPLHTKPDYDAQSREYISNVLNSDFNELRLSQSQQNQGEQHHQQNMQQQHQHQHQMQNQQQMQQQQQQQLHDQHNPLHEILPLKEEEIEELVANSEYNYHLQFNNELDQPQQATHNPQMLWDEPHGFFQ